MRIFAITTLIFLMSCSHQRGPASSDGQAVAHDSMALGNIQASAVKVVRSQDVCFDITLKLKGVNKEIASPANWQIAWIDQASRYHLLTLNQRDPASVPQGGTEVSAYGAYQEWNNQLRTCASKARLMDVKTLVLTPKELPYKETEGMHLEWK